MCDYRERFANILATRVEVPTIAECTHIREGKRVIQVKGPDNRYYLYDKTGDFLFDLQTNEEESYQAFKEIEDL